MVVEHYISELLYRYNCVIVPGFGAFLTQMKAAYINTQTNTFSAPAKTIAFNEQIVSNDGLLVSFLAEAEKTGYEPMLLMLSEKVADWKKKLGKGEKLVLADIGELWYNTDRKILFQPYDKINYLTSSFGLAPFVTLPVTRETLKKTVEAIEEKTPLAFTPERRKEGFTLRPYLKYAAITLLAISLGLTGYRAYEEAVGRQQLVFENAQEQVAKRIQEATFFDVSPMELPTLTLDVTKERVENVSTHHIVAGAFRFRMNADKKMMELKRKGFNPSYMGTNAFGLHMITYDSYTNADEALNALKNIKATQSEDAWLLSIK